MERVSAVQSTLSSERSRHDCAVAKSSNADRISALCFTAFQAIACCCLFARGRHGKSKPRPVLAHRRWLAAWLCCGNGHSSTQNCKSALGFTSSLEALSAWRQISRWRHFLEATRVIVGRRWAPQGENRNQLLQSRQVRYRLQAVAPNIPLPVLARRKTQLEPAQCTPRQLDRKIWSDWWSTHQSE